VCTPPATDGTIEPVAALSGAYDEAYARYRALYPAIKSLGR
jgi:xylulokinase